MKNNIFDSKIKNLGEGIDLDACDEAAKERLARIAATYVNGGKSSCLVFLVLLITFLTLIPFTGCGQLRDLLRDPAFWVGNSAAMIGGAADGTNEVISHHYYKFEAVFPRANDQYWNPNLSWTNKYSNPFPGKTSILVWTTDGYHMTRAVDNLFTITVMPMFTTPSAVDLFDPETPKEVKWRHVKRRAIEGLSHYLFRQLAFTLVYDQIF